MWFVSVHVPPTFLNDLFRSETLVRSLVSAVWNMDGYFLSQALGFELLPPSNVCVGQPLRPLAEWILRTS